MILFDHFAAWRFFLAVLILLSLEGWMGRYRKRTLQTMVRQGLRSQFIVSPSGAFFAARAVLLVLAAGLAVAAMMGPKGHPRPLQNSTAREIVDEKIGAQDGEEKRLTRRKAHDVIVLLDASASMEVQDTRIGASRLDYAKEIVDEIASRLRGESIALYAFTSELTTVVPSTCDILYCRLQLRRVKINEGDAAGTDLMEALDQVIRRHAAGGSEKARTLVLLTDGGDTRLEALKGEEREQELNAILSRLEGAEECPLTTYCIGLGSHEGQVIPHLTFEGKPVTSSLDESLLKALACKGHGCYLFANDQTALSIADQIVQAIEAKQSEVEEEVNLPSLEVERTLGAEAETQYSYYFQLPLLLAILALVSELLLSLRHVRRTA